MTNFETIITSIDDQDVYKKYMQYFFIEQGLGDVIVEYEFFNRGKTKFVTDFYKMLRHQVNQMGLLTWNEEKINHFKKKCPFLPDSYFEFLKTERYNPEEVTIKQEGEELSVKIKGPLKSAINWEVPLMAVISELNNLFKGNKVLSPIERFDNYIAKYNGFKKLGVRVAEFGTRRRASFAIQLESLMYFKNISPLNLAGTSNIALGRIADLPLKGTIAHETYMLYAALYGVEKANEMITEQWWNTFKENVDCMLPDTFTTNYFLKTVNPEHFKNYRSIRQDSMDPNQFTDLIRTHYKSLDIDSKSKTIIYSNDINSLEKLEDIHTYAKQYVQPVYGIGTWLSNDCGSEKMNMVIKLTGVYKQGYKFSCVKLSDVMGKLTGDKQTAYDYLKIIS